MHALVLVLSMSVPAGAWQPSMDAGETAYQKFDYATAERSFTEAAAFAERFSSRDPRRAETLLLLADTRLVLGKDAEAEAAYRESLEIQERAFGPSDPRLNRVLWNLFAVCTVQGKRPEAGAYFKRLVPEPVRLTAASTVVVDAKEITKLSLINAFPLRYAEALARRTLRLHERVYGRDSAAGARHRLAECLREQRRDAEAQALDGMIGAADNGR